MEDVKEQLFFYLQIPCQNVSILVLMEDVKERIVFYYSPPSSGEVSILVLMEDVKELSPKNQHDIESPCFNPCFNGRCKRTLPKCVPNHIPALGFNPCFNGRCKRTPLI